MRPGSPFAILGHVTVSVSALRIDLRASLAAVAQPSRAPEMQRYMKSSMPFLGLPKDELRRVCRLVFARHPLPDEPAWRAAVLEVWDRATHREERYAAIELTGSRLYRAHQRPEALSLYRHLVVTGAWWDLVDEVASGRVGPILRAYPAEVVPVVRAWAVDPDLWLRRTAVICQLGSKEATDRDLLRYALEHNLADSPCGSEFFIRKAVGWALRQHARIEPGWVRAFVEDNDDRVSGLTRREALKHL